MKAEKALHHLLRNVNRNGQNDRSNLELQQTYDFCDESNAVYKLLSSLSDSDYEEKTQFKGWNFNNIGHLHVWEYTADLSLQDGDEWKNFANSALEMLGKGSTMNQFEETITKRIKGENY